MDCDDLKSNSLNNSELQRFLEHLKKSCKNQFGFTIGRYIMIFKMIIDLFIQLSKIIYFFALDHLESSLGLAYDRENPSQTSFCLALLHEVLFNLKQSHVLWGKLKYAVFLLNIAERKYVDFGIIYNIFNQVN